MEENQPVIPTQTQNVGFPGTNTPTTPQSNKNWKWLIVLVLFLIVIAGVTFFVFKSSRSASTLEESPTPASDLTNVATPEPTQTPEASPADKTQVKIQVLNGTGVAGEAGLLSDSLKSLGYTNITTGNASDQNATDTSATFSSTLDQGTVTEITNKLKDLYTSVTTNTGSAGDYDIQITTGHRKGQTAPTATPSDTTQPTDTPSPSPTPNQ